MMPRYCSAVLLVAVFLPLSLSAGNSVFYQCVDKEGVVHYRDTPAYQEMRCLQLGLREEKKVLDDKVRKNFADPDTALPPFEGNVVQNSREGLRSFHKKLEGLAAGRSDALNIYFVGDSHLQSGDFIRGFIDEFDQRNLVGQSSLCVHKVKKVRVARTRGTSKKKKYVLRLPKDYPNGVKRICIPLLETKTTGTSLIGNDQDFLPALAATDEGRQNVPAAETRLVNIRAYGISGKTFGYFAGSTLLEHDLVQFKPDLIVVMLGTNDAFTRPERESVKNDILEFVSLIRMASPASEVLFISPPDSYFKQGRNNEYIDLVRTELRTVAGERGFAFWDLYAVMGGQYSMTKWRERGLSQKDRIHFLSDGYQILGRLFFQAVVQ